MEGGGAGWLIKMEGGGIFQRCEEMEFLWKGAGLAGSVRWGPMEGGGSGWLSKMVSYGRWWGFPNV